MLLSFATAAVPDVCGTAAAAHAVASGAWRFVSSLHLPGFFCQCLLNNLPDTPAVPLLLLLLVLLPLVG
jgi:hypothetical protein